MAVALGYHGRDLPKVLASGKGALAEQIIALALEQGVRVRKDADLAELLSAVDIDCEIPLEAIYAVAEILAYVYRANGKSAPGSLTERFEATTDAARATPTPRPAAVAPAAAETPAEIDDHGPHAPGS
jgi:flagellar biosynthesis protein